MPNARVQSIQRLLSRTRGTTQVEFTDNMVVRLKNSKRVGKMVKPASVVTANVEFKANHSAKSEQAWRYPGGVIQRAPQIKINGTNYTDHKDSALARRKQESNFFITLNTNIAPKTEEQSNSAIQALTAALNHISKDSVLATCMKFGPVTPHYENDKYQDVIISADWKSAIETGEKLSRLHSHIWSTVTHYSQIQMNSRVLQHVTKSAYNAQLGGKKTIANESIWVKKQPYCHVKLLPQSEWATIMRGYITKSFASDSGYSEVH